ncbi:hypothetical protein PABG_03231 [Paracoccidioides brasiliensis Pb03]|nr:hypothetical protein PABG_03231 [Paracoccidioides brasiliensis Pb03]
MADKPPSSTSSATPQNVAPNTQNPALRMLGVPKIRFKLPSRNWLIFLSITGSFTTALIYDRRQKRKAQEKWSNLVAHIAKQPLPPNETRRKLTVFLAAPPGDGLMSAREYFKEYIKPIIVAGALDYEVVEGRKEGDIRATFANRIRKARRRAGEGQPIEEDEAENFLQQIRQNFGIEDEPGIQGDMVIGRHTWKEYIRGLHEGWLGPIDEPHPEPETIPGPEGAAAEVATQQLAGDYGTPAALSAPQENKKAESAPEKKPEEEKTDVKKLPRPTPAYILPSSYPSQRLAPSTPQEIDVSPVRFPHILGFFNTPIRIYRFLTQRYLADAVGRDVAAIVLAASTRPYTENSNIPDSEFRTPTDASDDASPTSLSSSSSSSSSLSPSSQIPSNHYEQQSDLETEEQEWPKSVRKQKEDPDIKEREWLDDIVMDPRIALRMHRFDLPPEEEERAQRIAEGTDWIRGEEKPAHVPFWKRMWNTYGLGEQDDGRAKVVIGNLDE